MIIVTTIAVADAVFDLKILDLNNYSQLMSVKITLWGGAIDIYETKNGPGILLSTSDVVRSNDEDIKKLKR